jgi:hypothetical protein
MCGGSCTIDFTFRSRPDSSDADTVPPPGVIRSQKIALPPVLTVEDTVNPLTYPLFASQRANRTDPSRDSYAPEAGYDHGRPRLGQGFQHDDTRRAKAGMTWKEALVTDHSWHSTRWELRGEMCDEEHQVTGRCSSPQC